MKKQISILFFLFLFFSSKSQNTPSVINGKKYWIHEVKKQETLFGISKIYNTSVSSIIEENHINNTVQIGQMLLIPYNENTNPPTHIVKKQETLYGISKLYEVSIEDLLKANPFAIDNFYPGLIIQIPKKTIVHKEINNYHLVQAKETWFSIAKLHETSVEALQKLNPQNHELKIGDTIYLINKIPTEELRTEKENNIDFKKIIHKDSFNISVLLPFYFNSAQNTSNQLDEKSSFALALWQGIKMAADSLAKKGLKAHINVYDSENNPNRITQIIHQNPEIEQSDLLIGPLYMNEFTSAANYAFEKKIPIVSPVLQQNKILENNVFVNKIYTSKQQMLQNAIPILHKKYPTANVYFIATDSNEYKQIEIYQNIYQEKTGLQNAQLLWFQNQLNDSFFLNILDSNSINLIFIISENNVVASNLAQSLNNVSKQQREIIAVVFDRWLNFDNIIDLELLENLHLHVLSNDFIDDQDVKINNFTKLFFEKYKMLPNKYALWGFDIAYYYLSNLMQNKQINPTTLKSYQLNLNVLSFKFDQETENNGFENIASKIIYYQNARFQELK